MEVTKTIKARVVGLTICKREALESEYRNYQIAVSRAEEVIEELSITTLKRAGEVLYSEASEHSLKRAANLYSATYQLAFKRALNKRRGRSRKEQPLRLRNDTFDVKYFENSIAHYWARIPVYANRGGIKVALRMSPKHEQLLQDPDIRVCDSELLRRGDYFFMHITVKKCVDITPGNGRLAVIGIDAGISNTATSVVWRDDRITGVRLHSGKRLKHKAKQMRARLAKQQKLAFSHNSYHCVGKALDREAEAGRKLSNYTRDRLHNISAAIIGQAMGLRSEGYDVAIACEDLKHIRKGISGKLHWWAFRQLLDFVRYKAQWAGIPFIEVAPANTSRACLKCGHCDRSNRTGPDFRCTECGYNANADLVGAANVAKRSLASPELYAQGKGRHDYAQGVVSATPQAMMPR
jgi:IS605 OrfB family transposase